MNYLHTTYALAIIGTLAVSGASMAATSTLDARIAEANRVAAVSSNYHVTARISGLLFFCSRHTLKDDVDQKIARDVMFDGKAGADFVQVDQSLRSYSTGVAMGLTLAVVPDSKKKAICAKTVEMAEQLLKQDRAASKP
jgi:hypothetical protein